MLGTRSLFRWEEIRNLTYLVKFRIFWSFRSSRSFGSMMSFRSFGSFGSLMSFRSFRTLMFFGL